MSFQHTLRRSLTAALGASAIVASAQLTVSPQADLQQLAANITGPGVTISNPTITCHAQGFGVFNYTGTALGADEGVILTTGRITDAPGPNNNGGNSNWFAQNTAGDAVLDAVTGRTTMDACKFEFDIIPTGDSLSFNFVFASEEYNEWVGSQYNDVFGFFISGPGIVGDPNAGNDKNIALIPGGNQPVTINTVNNGSNPAFYQDNTGGADIQYDGFTQNLVARTAVNACQTYHLKLIIADASDRRFDSGVFIERIKSSNVTMQAFTANGSPNMVEGCNPGWVRFSRPFPRPTPLSIQYFIQGTATNGTDYSAIAPTNPAAPKTVVIPANQTFVDRPVNPLSDPLSEPTEFLTFILGNPFCPAQALDTLQFNIVDTLIATVSPGNVVLCAGDSVQYTVTGGANYNWSPAATVSSPTSATTWVRPTTNTNYTITITEGTCSRTVTRQVRVSHLVLTGNVTPPLCNASTNGAIDLGHSGGFPPYTYAWTGPNGFTASTQDITGLAPGTYTVVVNDAACTRTRSFNVIAPAVLGVTTTPSILPFGQNIACNGGSTGSIATVITGGVAPYTVAWTGPNGFVSSSPSLSGLAAGTYNLLVTDVNGCTVSSSVTLTQPQPMSAAIGSTTPVQCFGDGQGSASATITGGIPPYTFAWGTTPVQATPTASGLGAGTYPVTITDGYGCTASATAVVAGPTAPLGTTLTGTTPVRCFGNSTGSASISITGGTPNYSTTWNTMPAQNGNTASNLSAGTWTATVTDANGCSTTRDVTITQPAAALTASISLQTNVACFGGTTGSATVGASGGTGPYTYSWNTTPVQNTATASGLAAGSYSCTVRDVNNCQVVVNVTITQPAAVLSTSIVAQANVSCFGGTTGTATIAATGGTAPYTYSWNTTPPQSSATATDLAAGTWTCTVTDANGCGTTRTVTITQPAAALSASTTALTNVNCNGASTGSATVNATGGTGPYAYQWNTSPVQNTATATGLSAGTWTCTITDGQGCATTRTVTITEPAAGLSVSIGTVIDVLVCQGSGSSNGSALATASGGTAPYAFSWNTVPTQTGASVSVGAAGTYTVNVIDANGCTALGSIAIGLAPTAATSITATTNVSCTGGANGSATVSSTGGGAVTSIAWNSAPVQNGATLTNVPAGTYTATVQHADGCVNTATVTIGQPAASLTASVAAQTTVSCFGGNDGTATAQAAGGTGPYTYQWNTVPVQNTAAAVNLQAGAQSCTITDANGCTTLLNVTIAQPAAALSTSLSSSNDVSCSGGNDGAANITASGGTVPYTYSWNTVPVQNGASASGLAAGTWTCTVTDGRGCTTTHNVTIAQPAAALGTTIGAQTNVACAGGNTGSATVSVSGGTAPYTYSWNTVPPQTTATANALAAGNWTCTVTDSEGCVTTRTVTISQPSPLVLSGVPTPATCGGSATGAVDATVTGGAGGYTYAWTGAAGFSASTQDIASLNAGVYTLVVTDANACMTTQAFNVGQPGLFSISGTTSSFTGGHAVSCANASNGSITQTITGGTAPYTYAWSGPNGFTAATEDLTGLAAGTYTMVITDGNGCSTSATYTLSAPAPLSAGLNAPVVLGGTNISCSGALTGSIDATITGGTGPMSFTWSGPGAFTGSTEDLSGLGAGAYTLTVTDVNGCTTNASITLTQPAALSASATMSGAVGCFGGTNGSIVANANGGTAPYTFVWNTSPAQSGANASGLAAGTYTVQVSDANGCTTSASATVTQPSAALAVNITAQTNVLIFGQSTGAASASATGGTAPYTYTWSTVPPQTTATANGLAAGTYTVTATDANGCTATGTVTISQPLSALSAGITAQTNVGCFGGSTGSATAVGNGGTAPYTYSWNTAPVQTSATATGLSAGTWTCTITDANGAIATATATITGPAAPLAAATSAQTNVGCRGNSSGSATITASGGTAPYTYQWNTAPVQTGATATGLSAGTWSCTVTDANGCTTTTSATITEPASILSASILSQSAVSCRGGSNGTVTAAGAGGTAPYSFQWNTSPAQGTATASGLAAGTWTCTVTDANGCSTSITATITEPAAALTATTNTLAQATCGIANGAANAVASGGTAPYTYVWNSTPAQTSATLTGVNAGGYTVTVTDANGCIATAGTTITSPSSLALTLASSTDQACFGSSSGQATVAAAGGIAPYTYTWNTVPAQQGATASGLAAGSYTATVTDGSGCTTTLPVVIGGPAAPLSLSITSVTNVLCHAAATGGAEVSANGGTAPYQYVWNTSPTVTGDSIGGLAAGAYAVSVSDANGCTANSTVTITQPAAEILAFVENFQHESCFGAQDGWVTLDVVGGSGSYTMTWNTVPPQSGPTAVGLGAGLYTLTVNDNNGCNIPKFYPVNINGPSAALSTALTAIDHDGFAISCPGGADGQVFANTTGGTAPYTYAWTGPNGPLGSGTQLAGLAAGSYQVITTDVNGCSTTASISLSAPTPLAISASITTAACMGTSTGAIDATLTGGTAPYTIQWNGPGSYFSTSTDITGLMAGVYTATLTDAHGCTGSFPFDVTQPGQVAVSGTVSTYAGGQNITCDAASDGSIDITATGGIAPYSYAWSGPAIAGSTTEDQNGLVAGSYNVVVTDANGCSALAQFTLSAPAPLNTTLINTTYNGADLSCANATDGAIDAGITGGTAPYTFAWSGPNGFSANTEDIAALGAGTYTLVVNDANGCTTSASVTLDQPNTLDVAATSPTFNSGSNISCDGASNGSIDLQLTGGTGFIQVSWSGPNGFTSSAPSPSGLEAGTYTLVATDANGCQANDTIVLSAPPPVALGGGPVLLANGTNLSCDQGNDGAIDLTVTGGAGNALFQWTGTAAFTANTEDVSGLGAGSYTVNVIDQNGCTASASFTLTSPAPLQAISSATPVACFASPTGALDLSITGGTLPYTYLWSGPGAFSANTEDISGLFAGGYIATITDASGCTLVHGATVTQPNTFQVSAVQPQYTGGNNVSCHGATDASIDVTVAGGVGPYFFAWSGPNGFTAITEDLAAIGAGNYILVLTDQNGCSTLLNYSVTGPDALALGLTPALFAGGANTGCSDSQDGSVDATVSGGIPAYTYAWTGPDGLTAASEDITGLEAGTYVLVVTDVLGCSVTDSVTLVPAIPVSAVPSATVLGNGANVSCADATDGSIDLTINGGAQPYTVIWTGPNGTAHVQEDLSNVPAGTYTASITDLNGCSTTASITLLAPDTLSLSLTASLYGNGFNLPCQGAAEGTLSALVSGGSPGYSYAWTGPNGFSASGAMLDSLVAGTYTVQVSDAAGCSATTSFTLTEPVTLNLTSAISDAGFGFAVSCAGNDGSIAVSATGGTTPYVFDWNGPNGFASLNEDLANLQAGTYQLLVSDANGCTVTRTFDLIAPAPVQLGTTVTGTICDNATDGAIDLAVTGGVQPMTFAWTGSNGLSATTEDLASLPGGTYSVIVTDAMNCQASTSAVVLASSPIDLSAYVSTYGSVNIPCAGDSSGVIELSIAGGAGTLDVQWTGPNGFTADTTDLSGLHAGTYTATITDVNGCMADTTLILLAPTDPIGATLNAALQPSGTNISCTGGNDGSIDASVVGGTMPYTFAWRGPDSTSYATEDLTALSAGTYDLVVTDANQCTFTTSITLTEPDSAIVLTTAISQFTGGMAISCDGVSDGWASVSAAGGSGGNTINWSGPNGFVAQGDSIGGLAAGLYTATITDINGCSASASIALDAPQPINATVTPLLQSGGTVISCAGASDGTLQAGASGGTAGYTFTWSGPGGATVSGAMATGIGEGTWCLLVTDTNGCAVQACQTITSPLPIALSGTTDPETCGSANGSIDLSIIGGTGPYTTAWSNGDPLEDPAGLVAGNYTVTVTDANGCTTDTTLVVNGSPTLAITASSMDNLCDGSSDGMIDLTPVNGTAPFTFVWSNGDVTEDITGLAAGTYSVLVSDASGCTWSDTLAISAPPALVVSADVLVHSNGYNISSSGGSNGAIALSASGGTAPYTYTWSNGASTAGVNALAAGTYTVLITDANGCTTTMTFTLTDPDGLAMPTGFSPNGDGANDAYVVQGLDGYRSRQLIVFNRWGNVVYESPNYANNWTGENNEGEQLPNGTYFVILRLNEGAETLQNYVDLRR